MTYMVRTYENDSYLALLIGLLRGQSQNFWSGPRSLGAHPFECTRNDKVVFKAVLGSLDVS